MDRSRLQFSFNAQNSPRSNLKNIPIFFVNTAKQMISYESTVEDVSFVDDHTIRFCPRTQKLEPVSENA